MPGTLRTGSRGCCTLEDSMDARRVCSQLGIPFFVWDFSERFKEDVVDDFISEYEAGRTPNPCMRCNERIKFDRATRTRPRTRLRRRSDRPLRPRHHHRRR